MECSDSECSDKAAARGLCRRHYARAHGRGELANHPRKGNQGAVSKVLKQQILDWMEETGRGHKAASKHFAISYAEVRSALGLPPQGSRAGARAKKDPDHPADLDRETYLRNKLESAERHIESMAGARSWQALVSANRLALSIRDELDQLRVAKEQSGFDPGDLEALVREILQLPDEVLLHPAVAERLRKAG